jgi:potassium-transporting ATPase KdpC subunit
MKDFFASLKPAVVSMALLSLLLGIIYPLFMYGVGELFFHRESNGSLIYRNGKVVGSEWIGQNFSEPQYFHPRPSSAGEKGYDAANSSGSNLGPTSQKLADALSQRIAAYRSENYLAEDALIPADAVTASGSGLDPHISVANALLQLPRVALARGMQEEAVRELIAEYTEGPTWGIWGEDRINVLQLNMALDEAPASRNNAHQK